MIDTSYYRKAHGRMPRGVGQWMFMHAKWIQRDGSLPDTRDSIQVYTVNGPWSEAKSRARKYFHTTEGRAVRIIVMP